MEQTCPKCDLSLAHFDFSGTTSIIRCARCGSDVANEVSIVDLRSEKERQFEIAAKQALPDTDETLAKLIAALVPFIFDAYDLERGRKSKSEVVADQIATLKTGFGVAVTSSLEAEKEIRKIGMRVCNEGGDERMRKIAYRAIKVGPPGAGSKIEMCWSGLCGWYNGADVYWAKHGL